MLISSTKARNKKNNYAAWVQWWQQFSKSYSGVWADLVLILGMFCEYNGEPNSSGRTEVQTVCGY